MFFVPNGAAYAASTNSPTSPNTIHGIDTRTPPSAKVIQSNAAAEKKVKSFLSKHQIHPLCASIANSPFITCTYDYVDLNMAYQTQQTGYWCGPASTSEVLAYFGFNYSQSYLASYEGTSSTYGTNTGNVQKALNNLTPPGYYWPWLTTGDANYSSDWYNDMYYSLFNRGKPAIDGIYMSTANGTYLNYNWQVDMSTYGVSQVWHYVASDGLHDTSSGHYVHYVDSFDDGIKNYQTNGPWWITQSTMITVSHQGTGLL